MYSNILLIVLSIWCSTTPINADSHAECVLKETCSSCIRTPGCAWCAVPIDQKSPTKDTEMMISRCASLELQDKMWCPQEHVVNMENKMDILEDVELSAGTSKIDAVQIRPQRVKLALRQGEEYSIPLFYQQAQDYPIDLYYLMDLSASMRDDRDKLSALGNKLASVLKKITNNVRMGFGSFVDKPEMPYVNTQPKKLNKPCENCVRPYGFKNHMPLTLDTTSFASKVNETPVSGNMDFPEGGFDGLMQAIVCTKDIGWRDKARKLLVFSTDATFHMAGDGKLAGIVVPNDEECHMENGLYTHSLITDYPSVSQLDKQAQEHNINIIFAVTRNQESIYRTLKENIQGAAIGSLSKDSSNIVDLVKSEYEKLVDSIILSDNSGGSVKIEYYTKCLRKDDEDEDEQKTNECGGLRGRPVIEFRAVVKAVDCSSDIQQRNKIIQIKPGGLSESLTIELELLCECPCEQKGHLGFVSNSPSCNSNGNLQCGICDCASGRYGRFCECDGDAAKAISIDTSSCRPNNQTTEDCSGLGFCKCGKCDCFKRANPEEIIYGTYCECNNFACKRSGGLLCSGPEKGRCDCGNCVCQSGWSGISCECRDNNATCTAPESTDVCSNHGSCVCGVCQCDMADKVRYSGRYCEECPSCSENKCDELRDCVECQVHKSGVYDSIECKIKCTQFQAEVVDKIIDPNANEDESSGDKICTVPDNGGCTILFKYKYEDDNISIRVKAQKTKDCAKEVDMIAVISGVVGGTVLAGLVMLIIWKVCTSMHDRREYVNFEKEMKMAKFDRGDNPLYKPSTSTFNNPTFGNMS